MSLVRSIDLDVQSHSPRSRIGPMYMSLIFVTQKTIEIKKIIMLHRFIRYSVGNVCE